MMSKKAEWQFGANYNSQTRPIDGLATFLQKRINQQRAEQIKLEEYLLTADPKADPILDWRDDPSLLKHKISYHATELLRFESWMKDLQQVMTGEPFDTNPITAAQQAMNRITPQSLKKRDLHQICQLQSRMATVLNYIAQAIDSREEAEDEH